MFSTLLLIGLVIGIIIYSVTYVYGRGKSNSKRSVFVVMCEDCLINFFRGDKRECLLA